MRNAFSFIVIFPSKKVSVQALKCPLSVVAERLYRELNERYTPLICCSIEKGGRLKRNLYPILMRVCVVYFIIIDIVTAQYWGEALVVQQLGCSCATLITNRIFFFCSEDFHLFSVFSIVATAAHLQGPSCLPPIPQAKDCVLVYVCMYVHIDR